MSEEYFIQRQFMSVWKLYTWKEYVWMKVVFACKVSIDQDDVCMTIWSV